MKKKKEKATRINVLISVLEDNVPSYIFNMMKHSVIVELDRQAKIKWNKKK